MNIIAEIIKINPLSLKPHPKNSRKHNKEQIQAIAESIKRYGFNRVVVIRNGYILSGHGTVEAAKLLKMNVVPCVNLDHLNDDEARAYIIADNRTAELSLWDKEILKEELQALDGLIDFDVMQLGALCGDLDFGEFESEDPIDRQDRLQEFSDDELADFENYEAEDDDDAKDDEKSDTHDESKAKKEPINYTFMVMLNARQHKRLSELKDGLSDKEFFLQNILGESE